MNIYFMRHGETVWNHMGKIQGSSDIKLTEYGRQLARDTRDGFVRDGIRFQKIFSSPYQRALETARIVQEKQEAEITIDPSIREMCFGKYEGLELKRIKESDPNIQACFSVPSKYQADPTGESFDDLYARTKRFLTEQLLPLESDTSVQNVLVVCHGAVIRAFLTQIRQMKLDEFWTLHQPNCSVNLVTLKHGIFTSVKENIIYYEAEEILHRGIL